MTLFDELDTIEKYHQYLLKAKGLKALKVNPQNESFARLLVMPKHGEKLPDFMLVISHDIPNDYLLLEFNDRIEVIKRRNLMEISKQEADVIINAIVFQEGEGFLTKEAVSLVTRIHTEYPDLEIQNTSLLTWKD